MAFTSRLAYFGFAKQTVLGTAVAPTIFPRWLDGSSLEPEVKFTEVAEGDGSRDYSLVFKEKQSWKAKLKFYPRPVELGIFLQAMMGAASDTITGSGVPYTHTFAPKDAFTYYTCEFGMNEAALVSAGSPIYRAQDMVLTSWELEGEPNKPVSLTVEFMGRKAVRQSAAATISLETGEPLKYANGVFKIDIAGSPTIKSTIVSKFKISVNHSVDGDILTNDIVPVDFIWTTRKINLEYECILENDSKYRQMFFGSETGTTDSVINGEGAIDFLLYQGGDVASTSTAQIKLNRVVYQGKPLAPKLDGKAVRLELAGLAVRPVSGNIIDAILNNSRSTAY